MFLLAAPGGVVLEASVRGGVDDSASEPGGSGDVRRLVSDDCDELACEERGTPGTKVLTGQCYAQDLRRSATHQSAP